MTGGFTGKILRLNLTDHTTSIIETSKYEEYGGGIGIGTAIFWDLVEDKTIDAFDPRNVITIIASPLNGALGLSASGRVEVNGIGPQAHPIGWFTRGNFGGRFGAELKYAGWDGVVIEGESESRIWVKIVNDRVTFEDAGDLWGKDTWTTQQKIWEKSSGGQNYGDWLQVGPGRDEGRTTQRPSILCIGPMGEIKARELGCLIHDAGNAVGQGGFGAVWGAKKLKAIGVIGTGSIDIADPQALLEAMQWAKKFTPRPEAPHVPGPTHFDLQSCRTGSAFKGMRTKTSRPQACMGCQLACRRRQDTGEGNESVCVEVYFYLEWVEKKYGEITAEANKACDLVQKFGANVYPLRRMLDYLNMLNEQGILGRDKAIHTDLPFEELGSVKFLEILFDKIIRGEDIGLDLRDGIIRAVEKWGRLEEDLKSGELAFPYWGYPEHGYDGRGSLEWGYGSIIADRDMNEHEFNSIVFWYPIKCMTDDKLPMQLDEIVEICAEKLIPFEGDPYMLDFGTENMYSEHIAKLVAWQKYYSRFWKQGIGYCDWAFPDFVNTYAENNKGMSPEAEPKFYNAVTGKNISFSDGMETGRKVWNIQNAIWALQGRHRDMVKFADYYYEQPLKWHWYSNRSASPVSAFIDGKWTYADVSGRKIDRDKFEEWKTIYYQLEGWDTKTGWPTRATLEKQGLGNVADELEKHGKLGA
ncbi:MAG: aldehyde ferredoxin oxidoreductase N-terminal domain-containing protein [Desulfatiglandales bacterium]